MGIIYIVQPTELIGTKRFKIGCSESDTLKRIKNYGKDAKIICILKCYEKSCFNIEQKILKLFSEDTNLTKFKREYFEGDEKYLYKMFVEYKLKYDIDIDNDNDNDIVDIENIFGKNYKTDKAFGGNLNLIKIFFKKGVKYIYYISENKELLTIIIKNPNNFINELIKKKIIENEKIYNLDKLENNIDRLKKNISINFEFFLNCKDIINNLEKISKYNDLDHRIDKLFKTNYIINNKLHVDFYENSTNYSKLGGYPNIKIININDKYYHEEWLIYYLPYIIRVNDNNEYYMLNRKYEYINTTNNFESNYDDIYIYGRRTTFINEKNKIIDNFNEITKNIKCLNSNENTTYILNL